MIRIAFSLLSPAGPRGRLSVLTFHRVLPAPDPIRSGEIDAARFDEICGWLASWARVLPLDEAVQRLAKRSLPARALAITFDDGYADNHDVALPILRKHRLNATFFIATGFLGDGRMWNDVVIEALRECAPGPLDLVGLIPGWHEPVVVDDMSRRRTAYAIVNQVKYLPHSQRLEVASAVEARCGTRSTQHLMMSEAQVRALRAAGMVIGAHTVSHPILLNLDAQLIRREVGESKDHLEALIGESVRLFAYPNGKPGVDYDGASTSIVRQLGFDAAFCTAWGAASAASDRYELPRFTPWDRTRSRYGVRLVANLLR
jgi:peptidoglycan/xylan/chitin deacetylase (PgdA/CDA1 family)